MSDREQQGEQRAEKPTDKPQNQPHGERKIGRRAFLESLRDLAIIGAATKIGVGSSSSGEPGTAPDSSRTMAVQKAAYEVPLGPEVTKAFHEPFVGHEANLVAQDLGINAGSFVGDNIDSEHLAEIKKRIAALPDNVFTNDRVMGVFPNRVMDLAPDIERYAAHPLLTIQAGGKEFQIPPNVGATVFAIESFGKTYALSPPEEFAIGSGQVIPYLHFDSLVTACKEIKFRLGYEWDQVDQFVNTWSEMNEAEARQYLAPMADAMKRALLYKDVGVLTSLLVLKKMHKLAHNRMEAAEGEIDPMDPRVWERTIGSYNAGHIVADRPFHMWPDVTQRYLLCANGMLNSAAIASRLEKMGLSSEEAAAQMVSPESTARVYSLLRASSELPVTSRSVLTQALREPGITANTIPPEICAAEQRYYREFMDAHNAGRDLLPTNVSPGYNRWRGFAQE